MEETYVKSRVVKSDLGIMVIGCCLGGGYNMLNLISNDDTEPVSLLYEKKAQKEELYDTELIAIVNADEGIKKQDDVISYSQSLLGTLNVKYETTGLEDAKRGIENGKYSAYMILPGTFSEAVESINGTPQKAVLEYAIAPNLTQDAQAKAIYSVGNAYTTLNNGISELYLSSVLTEVHKVQDAAGNIKENDVRDLKALGEVSGDDLRETIELPELATVEKNIEVLDLVPHYEEEDKLLAEIDKTYQEAWNKGDEEYKNVSSKIGELNQTLYGKGSMHEAIQAFNMHMTPYEYPEYIDTNPAEQKELGVIRDSSIEALEGIPDKLKEIVCATKEYFAISKFIIIINMVVIDLERWGAADSSASSEEECDGYSVEYEENTYSFYRKKDVDEKLVALENQHIIEKNNGLANYYNTISDFQKNPALNDLKENFKKLYSKLEAIEPETYLPVSDEQWENYIKSVIPAPIYEVEPNINEVEDLNSIQIKNYRLKNQIEEPKFSDVNVDVDAIRNAMNEMMKVSEAYAQDRGNILNGVNDELQEKDKNIKDQVTNLREAYDNTDLKKNELDEALLRYTPQEYLNQEALGQLEQSLDKNQSKVEEKIENQNKQYESYVEEVYKASEDNTKKQSESIEAGEKASNEKLDTNLANAKSLKQSTYEDNKLMLNDISGVLPYSRLGTQENIMAYRFMTEPLSVNDLTVAKKENLEGQEVNVEVSDEKKEVEEKETPIFIWVIPVVLLAVCIGSYFAFRKKRIDSNEDHL